MNYVIFVLSIVAVIYIAWRYASLRYPTVVAPSNENTTFHPIANDETPYPDFWEHDTLIPAQHNTLFLTDEEWEQYELLLSLAEKDSLHNKRVTAQHHKRVTARKKR